MNQSESGSRRGFDWGCMSVLLVMLFSSVFGWQMGLFFPPDEYRFALYIVAGGLMLLAGLAAARR